MSFAKKASEGEKETRLIKKVGYVGGGGGVRSLGRAQRGEKENNMRTRRKKHRTAHIVLYYTTVVGTYRSYYTCTIIY